MGILLRLLGVFLCSMLLSAELYATMAQHTADGVHSCDPVTDTDCTVITENIFLTTPHSTIPADGGLFTTPGLQIGGFLGQTPYSGYNLNYAVRAYTRQGYGQHFFGEASISLGVVSGPTYKSRLLPVEYRLNYQLAGLGMSDFELFNRTGSPYVYIGGGLLYHMPVALPAPDDPLTVDMGDRLPASPFWEFDGGISAVVPAGVGVDFRLDPSTVLNLQFGYNHSIAISDQSFENGYWGMSIGLNFSRSRGKVHSRAPIAHRTVRAATPRHELREAFVQRKELSPVEHTTIEFDLASSNLDNRADFDLSVVAHSMNRNPDMHLYLSGHVTPEGDDAVNDMLMESRARAVRLALNERGVSSDRITTIWRDQPESPEIAETIAGWEVGRLVIFAAESESVGEEFEISSETEPVAYELNEPIYSDWELSFNWLKFDKPSDMEDRLAGLIPLLEENSDLKLHVATFANYDGPEEETIVELSKARAEMIRSWLIKRGVDPNRVEGYNPYNEDNFDVFEPWISEEIIQQVLIIPVAADGEVE